MTTLLSAYCLVGVIASLFGGWIPLLVRLTHRRVQIGVSLVAGLMLGVSLLHLLPHAAERLRSLDDVVAWSLAGFLLMFFLERFLHFHHHDAPDTPSGGANDPHAMCDHPHKEHHAHADAVQVSGRLGYSWLGAAVGVTLHSLLDGLALAAAVSAELQEQPALRWAGLGTFLAVTLHKPLDSLSIGALMAANGSSRRSRHWVNALHALVLPCGAAMFLLASQRFTGGNDMLVGRALALSSGTFLCIAASDLLPEVQFHSHDRLTLSLALLLGVALAWGIGFFEAGGHAAL